MGGENGAHDGKRDPLPCLWEEMVGLQLQGDRQSPAIVMHQVRQDTVLDNSSTPEWHIPLRDMREEAG
jgi:hypothetical protein